MITFPVQAVYEDSGFVILARVKDADRALITQSTISTIVLTVRELSDPETDIAASPYTLDKTAVVFDTLQTGAAWERDGQGYNFRYNTLAAQVPEGNKTYQFEFMFTPVSGAQFPLVVQVKTKPIYGS